MWDHTGLPVVALRPSEGVLLFKNLGVTAFGELPLSLLLSLFQFALPSTFA
jgi:hypothetical protein